MVLTFSTPEEAEEQAELIGKELDHYDTQLSAAGHHASDEEDDGEVRLL